MLFSEKINNSMLLSSEFKSLEVSFNKFINLIFLLLWSPEIVTGIILVLFNFANLHPKINPATVPALPKEILMLK